MPTILIADSDAAMRQMVTHLLQEAGFQVVAAVDGQDAWEKSGAQDLDLVLTKQVMHRMDGLSLARKLHADLRLRDVPILLLTADQTAGQVNRAAGITDYLTSPIDPAQLLEVIGKVLR